MPQPRSNFIEPCLPSPADKPPSLLTRNGNDWSSRFPLVVEAVNHLKVRSCLIDGKVVCCDERGLSMLRQRRNEATAFLFAFDLLELNELDMRREPIETRRASILRNARPGVRLNEHTAHPKGAMGFQHAWIG